MLTKAADPKKAADAFQEYMNPAWQTMYASIVSAPLVQKRRITSHSDSRSQLDQVLMIKFNTYSRLKEDLLATGDAELILVCSLLHSTLSSSSCRDF